jgi:hypothetical protein
MFINKMLLIFGFLLVDFGSFHSRVDNDINDSLTILSLNTDETVRNLNI